MSRCAIRQVPSAASGLRGANFLIPGLTRKFHDTSVTRSRMEGNARIGSTVTGSVRSSSLSRVMHMSSGMPLILGRAGAALAGLAVPAAGQIIGVLSLNLVHGIEDDHAFGDTSVV